MRYIWWRLCEVLRKKYLTGETFLKAKLSGGWIYEVISQRVMRVVCGRMLSWKAHVLLLSPAYLYVWNEDINVWLCTQQAHQGVMKVCVEGGVITKISWFCEHCNGLILHFITHCFMVLACFRVGIVYIHYKSSYFKILIHNKKNCSKRVYHGTKRTKCLKLSPNK